MSWYRLAQDNSFALSKIIAQWLVQAFYGPVDMKQVHSDINALMPRMDDEHAMNSAILSGETMARTQLRQSGEMTITQKDVLDNVKQRLSGPQMLDSGELNNVPSTQGTQETQTQGEIYVENN